MNIVSRLLFLGIALFFGQHTVFCTNTNEPADTFDGFYEFDIAPICQSDSRIAINRRALCNAITQGLTTIEGYSPKISAVIPATKKVGSISFRDNTLQNLLQAQHVTAFLKGYEQSLNGCTGSIEHDHHKITENISYILGALDEFLEFEEDSLEEMLASITHTQEKALKKASLGTYLLSYAIGIASCDKHSFSNQKLNKSLIFNDLSNRIKKELRDAGEPDESFNKYFSWLNNFSWNQSQEKLVRELHKHALAAYATFNGA